MSGTSTLVFRMCAIISGISCAKGKNVGRYSIRNCSIRLARIGWSRSLSLGGSSARHQCCISHQAFSLLKAAGIQIHRPTTHRLPTSERFKFGQVAEHSPRRQSPRFALSSEHRRGGRGLTSELRGFLRRRTSVCFRTCPFLQLEHQNLIPLKR